MRTVKLFKADISICRHFGYRVQVYKFRNTYAVFVEEQFNDDPKAPFGDGVGASLSEIYIRKEMHKQDDYLSGFFQGLYCSRVIMKTHYYSLGVRPSITKIRTPETANNVAKTLTFILKKAIQQATQTYHAENSPAE